MPWLQLHIPTGPDLAEAIEDALLSCGAAAVTLRDNADQPILEPALGETPLWQQTVITGLFDAEIATADTLTTIQQQLGQPLPAHRWEQLEDKDWQRAWMDSYQPIHCGGRLWICPSWKSPPEPDAVNVLLDPGLAFGTGTHPTTLLCLQWLAGEPLADKTLLDYGCGSGILGIAGLLLGARRVMGVDIDPQALTASRDNARRNSLPMESLATSLPHQLAADPADIVLANILAGPLVELAETLAAHTRPGGRLCLSGVLDTQADAVMAAYRPHFAFDPVRDLDHWVQLSATRLDNK